MRGKRISLAAVAAAIVLAGGTSGCGGADNGSGGGDAAGQAVKVGGIFDLSGDTADVGTPYADGIKGFVRYWNEHGRRPRIDLTSEDYKYEIGVAERLYSSLKREGVVAFQGWGTGDTEALRRRVTADRVAFMSASLAETLTKPSGTPFNFVPATSYSEQMRIALRWIRERARGAEVASFHHPSPFGTSPQKAGAQTAEQLGLGFASYAMPDRASDYAPQLRLARSQGARFVVIQNTSTDAATLARNIAERHLDMKIVCLNWCADELFIELAGKAADGAVGVMPFAPATVKADGLAAPRAFLAERGRTLDQEGLHYVQGWYTMALMAEGIRRAADQGRVTGRSIRQALEQMPAFHTGGVSAPVDFTAQSHAGMKNAKLYVVSHERWSPLTG
jgi:branched-chain amino acid transport system substrate-binding protein